MIHKENNEKLKFTFRVYNTLTEYFSVRFFSFTFFFSFCEDISFIQIHSHIVWGCYALLISLVWKFDDWLLKILFFWYNLDGIYKKFKKNHVTTIKLTNLRCLRCFWGRWIYFYIQKPDYNAVKFRFCKHDFVRFWPKTCCLGQIVEC